MTPGTQHREPIRGEGAEQVRGALVVRSAFKRFNRLMLFMWHICLGRRINFWPAGTGRIMVIGHVGRRSAKPYRTPVKYAEIEGGLFLLGFFFVGLVHFIQIAVDVLVQLLDGALELLLGEDAIPPINSFELRSVDGDQARASAAGLSWRPALCSPFSPSSPPAATGWWLVRSLAFPLSSAARSSCQPAGRIPESDAMRRVVFSAAPVRA